MRRSSVSNLRAGIFVMMLGATATARAAPDPGSAPAASALGAVPATMRAMRALANEYRSNPQCRRVMAGFSNLAGCKTVLLPSEHSAARPSFGLALTVRSTTRSGKPRLVERLFRLEEFVGASPVSSTFFYEGGRAIRRHHDGSGDHGWRTDPSERWTQEVKKTPDGYVVQIGKQGIGRWNIGDPKMVAGLARIGRQTVRVGDVRQIQLTDLTLPSAPVTPEQTRALWKAVETQSVLGPQPRRGADLARAPTQATTRAVAATPDGMRSYVERRLAGGAGEAVTTPANLVSWKAVPVQRAGYYRGYNVYQPKPLPGIELTVRSQTRSGEPRLVRSLYVLEDFVGPRRVETTYFYGGGKAKRIYPTSTETIDHGTSRDRTTELSMQTRLTGDGQVAANILEAGRKVGGTDWRRAHPARSVAGVVAPAAEFPTTPEQTMELWDRAIGNRATSGRR